MKSILNGLTAGMVPLEHQYHFGLSSQSVIPDIIFIKAIYDAIYICVFVIF